MICESGITCFGVLFANGGQVLLWLKVAQCYAAIKENAEAICVYYRGNTGTHSISSNPLDCPLY
jgi:hypothetical protein